MALTALSAILFLTTQYHIAVSETDCFTVYGQNSRSKDDSQSIARCDPGYSMVSCGIWGAWGAIDGSYIQQDAVGEGYDECHAQIGYGSISGSYVIAQARCCKLDTFTQCQSYMTRRSGGADDERISFECPWGTVLTGCTVYSKWKEIDGAYPGGMLYIDGVNEKTCLAQNGYNGNGVHATATCCSSWKLSCYHTYGPRSGKRDDDESVVQCKSGYFMAGCSGFSYWKSAEAWYITNSPDAECRARNKRGGNGVWAIAICCIEK